MTGRSRRLILFMLVSACAAVDERPSPTAERAAASPGPGAALHHDVRVSLAPDKRRLTAVDTVTLSPELRARLGDRVVFSLHAGLSPERVGPGAPLEPASGGPSTGGGAGSEEEHAPVPLERFAVKLGQGERSFTVRYGGEIFHPIEQRGAEYERSMSESPGLVSRDGAVLSGSTVWLPDLPGELITFTLEARVPAGWDVVSQGARTRHERDRDGTVVRWESPEPQDEAFLVAGPFVERARRSGRVLVQTFLRSDDPVLADRYLTTGEQYLSMYEGLLGTYPYAKLAVVENFWETGYGMPSFTLLGPGILRFPFILHSSYPHEILHNWWGNGVFVDAGGGNWAEGLTAYLADHLVKEQRGEGAEYRRTSLQRYADHVADHQDFAVREFRARHGSVTQAIGYDKVLMVFHMLRRKLGDEKFVAGLRRFYEEGRFRAASFADLGRAMGAVAGEDLAAWLAQWVDRPGAPTIRLDSVELRRRDRCCVVELTLAQAQGGALYEVDVPVYLTVGAERRVVQRSVRLAERRQRFTLETEETPTRVDVDPEYDVFRRLDPGELPPALSGAFGASDAVIVLPSSAPPELRSAYAALAETWKPAEVVSDTDLARLPAGKAAWVLGWENRLRDAVAPGVKAYGGELSPDRLRVGATALSRDAHSVVVAVRSPADASQVAVFIGAENPRALPGLGRKLPHYGKYGLLGFEGDAPSNTVKETWPVPGSPMAAALGTAAGLPARGAFPARKPLAELPPPGSLDRTAPARRDAARAPEAP